MQHPVDEPPPARTVRGGLAAVAEQLAALAREGADGRRIIVLIDGRSGAGKSTLATALAALLDAELVRLDDVYPGWDGLEQGALAVHTEIIPGSRWHRWSWTANERTDRHDIDPARALVVEGCGALSRASSALATCTIWVELDDAARRERALTRDGDAYAPHWERWARQEEEFAAREDPRRLADIEVSGDLL